MYDKATIYPCPYLPVTQHVIKRKKSSLHDFWVVNEASFYKLWGSPQKDGGRAGGGSERNFKSRHMTLRPIQDCSSFSTLMLSGKAVKLLWAF